MGLPNNLARGAWSEPEIGNAKRDCLDLLRIYGKALFKQVARIPAVRGNFSARSEDARRTDREALQPCLGFVDLGTMNRNNQACRRAAA